MKIVHQIYGPMSVITWKRQSGVTVNAQSTRTNHSEEIELQGDATFLRIMLKDMLAALEPDDGGAV